MTPMPPERLAGLLTALMAMAPEGSIPPLEQLIYLAHVADANGKAALHLHPPHTTVQ